MLPRKNPLPQYVKRAVESQTARSWPFDKIHFSEWPQVAQRVYDAEFRESGPRLPRGSMYAGGRISHRSILSRISKYGNDLSPDFFPAEGHPVFTLMRYRSSNPDDYPARVIDPPPNPFDVLFGRTAA